MGERSGGFCIGQALLGYRERGSINGTRTRRGPMKGQAGNWVIDERWSVANKSKPSPALCELGKTLTKSRSEDTLLNELARLNEQSTRPFCHHNQLRPGFDQGGNGVVSPLHTTLVEGLIIWTPWRHARDWARRVPPHLNLVLAQLRSNSREPHGYVAVTEQDC